MNNICKLQKVKGHILFLLDKILEVKNDSFVKELQPIISIYDRVKKKRPAPCSRAVFMSHIERNIYLDHWDELLFIILTYTNTTPNGILIQLKDTLPV